MDVTPAPFFQPEQNSQKTYAAPGFEPALSFVNTEYITIHQLIRDKASL